MDVISESELRKYLTPETPLVFYNETDSTNNIAKRLARSGASHGTAVVALRQTAGRGRLGRLFLSPAGGLYLSVLLRPTAPVEQLHHLTLLFADAARQALLQEQVEDVEIKWPNDLILGNKKLGGILTEGLLKPDGTFDWLICGIGLNTAQVPHGVESIAASLENYGVNGNRLCGLLIEEITAACDKGITEKALRLHRVRQHCCSLNRGVVIHSEPVPFQAFAEAIEEDGALRVRLMTGETKTVSTGEVLLQE